MNAHQIDFSTIDGLTGSRIGTFDTPCPLCSSFRKPRNQKLKVFRIWRKPDFASYCCQHCGATGFARDGNNAPPDPRHLQQMRSAIVEHEQSAIIERRGKARWLWSKARPINDSIAETYLREARNYQGPLPSTLRCLPAQNDCLPALVAAFCLPKESEPGILAVADDDIEGVQLTRLAPNGQGKAGTDNDKIAIGRCLGTPIVLAPPNDLLGLAIAEGIEDGLSVYQSTGLGSWASAGASRLPALAAAIPDYIEAVTIMVDNDRDGERNAGELEQRLALRGIEVNLNRIGAQQ
jgi:hypothetical protein